MRAYGWKKQDHDHRDFKFVPHPVKLAALPPAYDQRSTGKWPKPYDQLQLGSCTGNGCAGVAQHRLILEGKQDGKDINASAQIPSRLFIYRQERVLEGTLRQDSGAQIRDGLKAMADKGFPFEDTWPYSDDTTGTNPPFIANPPHAVWGIAWHHRITKYEAVQQDLAHLKAAIAADNPVVFGFFVYESFETDHVAKTGIVPMPAGYPNITEQCLGGHCVVLVGYDDSKQMFICRNSWGTAWGDGGYFYMPYQYVLDPNLSSDFWAVDAVP